MVAVVPHVSEFLKRVSLMEGNGWWACGWDHLQQSFHPRNLHEGIVG